MSYHPVMSAMCCPVNWNHCAVQCAHAAHILLQLSLPQVILGGHSLPSSYQLHFMVVSLISVISVEQLITTIFMYYVCF